MSKIKISSKRVGTTKHHGIFNNVIVGLLDDLRRVGDDGLELISHDSKLKCKLMGNQYYNNQICALYARAGGRFCLRCSKNPGLRNVSEFRSIKTVRRSTMPNMNWTTGYCPKCQPNREGEPKSLLNDTCLACRKTAKGAVYKPRASKTVTFTPPEGFLLIKQNSTISSVMESANRNRRTLDAEMEMVLEKGLSADKPSVDFEKLLRLIKRRRELGTSQEDHKKAYFEAFDRIELLIGDIQAGDI